MKFFTDVSSRANKLYVRYVENGCPKKEVIEYQPELFIKTKNQNPDKLSMHDEPLERVQFSDIKEMREFISNYKDVQGFSVFGSENPINQFIARAFPGNIAFESKYIKHNTTDIETFSGSFDANGNFVDGPFPDPETAEYPVVLITVHDKPTDTYYVFGLEYIQGRRIGTYVHDKNHPRIGNKRVIYRPYSREQDMLQDFVIFWQEKEYNSWSGWNIEGFDNPYLTNRIDRVLGETAKKKLSPWNIVIKNTRKNDWGGESTVFEWMGTSMLDYMALFKKHAFMNPDDYKLNTVATMVLGEGKLDYHEGNPNELYAKNYQTAVEYNIVDVSVIVDMDNKMQLVDLTYTLAYMTKSNYQDTLGTVKPWSALAYSMLYDRGVVPKIKSVYEGDTRFAGGFVRVVEKPGRFRWVVSCDLNSLN